MAKKETQAPMPKQKPKPKQKKPSKLKWFIFILILIGAGSLYYIYQRNTIPLVQTFTNALNSSKTEKSQETFIPSTDTTKFQLFDQKQSKSQTKAAQVKQQGDYYVLMQVCLSLSCVRKEKRNIQAIREQSYITSHFYKTNYYEVVSSQRLSYKKSKTAIDILNRNLFVNTKPFIRQVAKEKYVVSFGMFDKKDSAEQLYLILLRTYVLTKIKFDVVKHKGNTRIYKVFAGGLTRTKALHLITKSHLQGEFSSKQLYTSKELKIKK